MNLNINDSFKTQGMRSLLIEELRKKGIKDEQVLKAMMQIPRHAFLESAFLDLAYQNIALPIASGQTISQPYTVAFQTELLKVSPRQKVLEIGTGSGYQCAVLCALGAKVFSIERQRDLFNSAKKMLPSLGYNPQLFLRDGTEGLVGYAPFDRIIVTAGAPEIPESLFNQLKIGGIMVIPVGNEKLQKMLRVTKLADGTPEIETFHDFVFVPLLGKQGW